MRLNEVITQMESLENYEKCMYCPFDEEGTCARGVCVYEDALQFLKLYEKNIDELHALIEDYCREVKSIRMEGNPALTFEELEQLEGCPVWVEANHAFIEHSGWVLVSYFEDFGKERGVNFVTSEHSEFFLIKDFIGITWNAYRQPYKKAEPKPDPEEYPVHCGCGGKAYVYKCEAEIDNPWTLMCEECGIMTKNFPSRAAAVKAWNKAMGANNANEA